MKYRIYLYIILCVRNKKRNMIDNCCILVLVLILSHKQATTR